MIVGTTLNESTTFTWRDFPVAIDQQTVYNILNDTFNNTIADTLVNMYPGPPFGSLSEVRS